MRKRGRKRKKKKKKLEGELLHNFCVPSQRASLCWKCISCAKMKLSPINLASTVSQQLHGFSTVVIAVVIYLSISMHHARVEQACMQEWSKGHGEKRERRRRQQQRHFAGKLFLHHHKEHQQQGKHGFVFQFAKRSHKKKQTNPKACVITEEEESKVSTIGTNDDRWNSCTTSL